LNYRTLPAGRQEWRVVILRLFARLRAQYTRRCVIGKKEMRIALVFLLFEI
jgi:hypothetical protein